MQVCTLPPLNTRKSHRYIEKFQPPVCVLSINLSTALETFAYRLAVMLELPETCEFVSQAFRGCLTWLTCVEYEYVRVAVKVVS